jgi:hypothetical protein
MSKLKELDYDYDINVDNMIPLNTKHENFDVFTSEFFSFDQDKFISMDILANDAGWQIFAMNDNTFILEVEDFDMGSVEYFQADNLKDILDTYEV